MSFANISFKRWDECQQANVADSRCDSTRIHPANQVAPRSDLSGGNNETTNPERGNLNLCKHRNNSFFCDKI